jgi:hypothetical protein
VISTAIQKNDKWDVQNLMPLWGHEVDWVASDADAKKLMERRGYDPRWYGLVVLPDSTLPVGPEVTKLLDGIRAAGNPLLVRNGVKVTTKGEVTALNGDMGTMLQTIVTLLARPDCGGFETVPYVSEAWGTGLPSLAAADRSCSAELVTGFDERVFFALDAALASRNVYLTPVANRDRVFGLAGYPVHTSQPFVPRGARTNRAYLPGGVTIVYKSDEQVKAEDLTAIAAAALTPPVTDHPTAAIALREGFDDYVFAATYAYLTWKGHKVAVVGPKKGELAGLNGVKADVGFTYADAIDLPKDAVIVAPGSIWPMKTEARQATQPAWIDEQDARDKARLAWITERYTGGARLLTFGFDSLAIGKQAAFKGLAFAASDQCVWSFGKDGGRYDNAPAVKTADRLISAKGAGAVAGAIRLFEGK